MDIFEFATAKEQYAERYYRELAAKTSNAGLKNILTMLADEEAKHGRIVQQMKMNTPGKVSATQVLANAKKVFEKMRGAADKFDFDASEADVYRKACDIEKESRQYYIQKAREVKNAAQKAIFRQLAAEENKHLLLVERIADFVARPETFLEDAEMYHFDDYAGGQF
jgi:rubrerythrin